MGAKLGTGGGAVAELNLTPLIDIVLVVLIIMMVTMPIKVEQMGVKLPGKTEVQAKSEVPADQLVIAVYPPEQEGGAPSFALNRKMMTSETLFEEVSRRLRPMDKKNVFIDAHPGVTYGAVVDMMDLAREAGAAQVGLAKMKESGPLPATSVATGSLARGIYPGTPTTVGAMSAKTADEALQSRKGLIMGCYERGLAVNPELSGRVTLRLSVGPQGEIMSYKIASTTLDSEPVESCLMELMAGFTFEALGEQKTALVQYPVIFSPG